MEFLREDKISSYLSESDLYTLWSHIRMSRSPSHPGIPIIDRSVVLDTINIKMSTYGVEVSEIALNHMVRVLSIAARSEPVALTLPIQSGNRFLRADNGATERVIASIIHHLLKPGSYLVGVLYFGLEVVTFVLADSPDPNQVLDQIETEYILTQVPLWKSRHKNKIKTEARY